MALEEVLGTAEARARNGAAGALEENSRLTALFLWTLQSTENDLNGANGQDEKGRSEESEDEEDEAKTKKKPGYTPIYDVARRFTQPLGIHLEKWEGRIIETEKGIVRLLPVAERAEQLFGEADAAAISRRIEEDLKASRNFLDSHQIRYTARVKLAGKSGYDHGVDFLIPKSPKRPERILQAIATPKKDNIFAYLWTLSDTRAAHAEEAEAEAYAFLNDQEQTVGGDVIEALEAYAVKAVPWSRRNEYVQELAP